MSLSRLLVVTAICLWTPTSALAEATPAPVVPATQTPEEVAEAALKAMRESRFDDYARFMHPEAAAEFKQTLMLAFSKAFENDQGEQLLVFFPGIKSIEELEAMNEFEFFGRYIKGILTALPFFRDTLAGTESVVLGSVAEGDSLAHVVYRTTPSVDDVKSTKLGVISFRRTEKGWGMLLTSEVERVAKLLQQRYAPE